MLSKKQIYFSFVTAALSFITLKTIQDAGVQQYLSLNPTNNSNNTILFGKAEDIQILPFELSTISGAYFTAMGNLVTYSSRTKSICELTLPTQSSKLLATITNTIDADGFTGTEDTYYLVSEGSDLFTYSREKEPQNNLPSSLAKEAIAYTYNPIASNIQVLSLHPEFSNQWTITFIDPHHAHESVSEELVLTREEFVHFQQSQEFKNFPVLSENFTLDGIAHDPKTNDFYVLSKSDRLLAKCNGKGKIQTLIYLNSTNYTRPTSILTHPDGSLYLLDLVASGTLALSKLTYTQTH